MSWYPIPSPTRRQGISPLISAQMFLDYMLFMQT